VGPSTLLLLSSILEKKFWREPIFINKYFFSKKQGFIELPVRMEAGSFFITFLLFIKEGLLWMSMSIKKIEITGSSRSSIEDAVENAIVSAAKTVHNMRWFEVVETRGYIENDKSRLLASNNQGWFHCLK